MSLNYTNARRGYLEWYSHLLSPPESTTSDTSRSEGEVAIEAMEQRIDGLNLASEELTNATKPYLESADQHHRVAALDSLLHQMEGDMEVANLLWTVIENTQDRDDDELTEALVRSVRGAQLHDTFRRLSSEMPVDVENVDSYYRGSGIIRRSIAHRPDLLDAALEDLRFEIDDTIALITDRANGTGLRLVRDVVTLGQAEWLTVLKAIDLLKGEEKAGDVGWGLEDEVQAAATGIASALRGVLVNIVEKILIVIEKNDLVRYTIADWLEDLRATVKGERKEHFARLLEQLYQTDTFLNQHLDVWLKDATNVQRIHQTADEVMYLGDNFDRLANQVRRLSALVGVGSLFVNPLLVSVGLALQIGLLSTLIFAGYDHLDEGARALNITKGVKEVLIENIPVSPQTLRLAEDKFMGAQREPRRTSRRNRAITP